MDATDVREQATTTTSAANEISCTLEYPPTESSCFPLDEAKLR